MKLFRLLTSLFLIVFSCLCSADPLYTFKTNEDANRFYALTKEIRCVVCQNQNIADSAAPLAEDLRNKVYQMVSTGKPDAEIKAYLVKRYGEFILFTPPFNSATVLLWLFPLLGVVGVMLLFISYPKGSR